MEYFALYKDNRIENAIEPIGLSKFINKYKQNNMAIGKSLYDLAEEKMGSEQIVQFELMERKSKEYVDFIDGKINLVSDKLKYILKKYDEEIFFKPVVLLDGKAENQELYWFIVPKEVDCLAEETQFNKDGSLKKLVIDKRKIGKAKIFTIKGVLENLLIVRLDAAESILRRDFTGIKLKKLESL
jgi:hypothetical protein